MFFSFQIHADLNWETVRNAKNNIQMAENNSGGRYQQYPQVEEQRAKPSDVDTCWFIVIQPKPLILSHKECSYLYYVRLVSFITHSHTYTNHWLKLLWTLPTVVHSSQQSRRKVRFCCTIIFQGRQKSAKSSKPSFRIIQGRSNGGKSAPPLHCGSDRSGRERKEEGFQIINGHHCSALQMKKKWEKEEKREPRV